MKTRLAIIALAIAPLTFVAAVCGNTTNNVQEDENNPSDRISVSGEGIARGAPDLALISLGISFRADTVARAREQAATAMDGVVRALRDNGVAEKDIQTRQLTISAEYNYGNNGQQQLLGFRVRNTVDAKIRNIDSTSSVIDAAVSAGGDGTEINGISFTIEDPTALEEEARKLAVAEARAKAQTLADAGGVDLGEPRSISEQVERPPLPYAGRATADSAGTQAAPETPVLAGELDVVVSVSMTFDLQ